MKIYFPLFYTGPDLGEGKVGTSPGAFTVLSREPPG